MNKKGSDYCAQIPVYEDQKALNWVLGKLHNVKALVSAKEILELKHELQLVEQGKAFVLQVGECAEVFSNCYDKHFLKSFCNFLDELSETLQQNLDLPIVKIGRIAGQFAKPRSSIWQEYKKIFSFRGEIINGTDINQRNPNPARMILGYLAAKEAKTFIDQHNKLNTNNLHSANRFNNIFISHEALLLPYEKSFIKKVRGNFYSMSAHTVWLGARTNKINSLHSEFCRYIYNPIGVKVHSGMQPSELIELIKYLNPHDEAGRIMLIFRFSNAELGTLEPYLKHLVDSNLRYSILCDPMHGNSKEYQGKKVRYLNDIVHNIKDFNKALKQYELRLQGLHLESISSDVTECIGLNVTENSINNNYTSLCDPRLNAQQTRYLIQNLGQIIE